MLLSFKGSDKKLMLYWWEVNARLFGFKAFSLKFVSYYYSQLVYLFGCYFLSPCVQLCFFRHCCICLLHLFIYFLPSFICPFIVYVSSLCIALFISFFHYSVCVLFCNAYYICLSFARSRVFIFATCSLFAHIRKRLCLSACSFNV